MEKMISSNAIHSLFTPPSRLPLSLNRRTHSTITPSCSSPLAFLSIRRTRTALSHLRGSPSSTVVRGIMLGNEEAESEELDDLPVDLCYTRTLPPALTLERGMAGIREEVERLKANPPCSSSGIVRIQVFVPPSAKALRLLCGQPQLSGVFPQFYLSKQNLDETTVDLHSLSYPNESRTSKFENSVSGTLDLGQVLRVHNSSCSLSLIKLYLSVESPLIRVYGFLDVDFDSKSSSFKRQIDSFHFLIPQIELDEYDGTCLLAATVAWNFCSHIPFEEAICSFESSFDKVLCRFSFLEDYSDICINISAMKSLLVEMDMKMDELISKFHQGDITSLEESIQIGYGHRRISTVAQKGRWFLAIHHLNVEHCSDDWKKVEEFTPELPIRDDAERKTVQANHPRQEYIRHCLCREGIFEQTADSSQLTPGNHTTLKVNSDKACALFERNDMIAVPRGRGDVVGVAPVDDTGLVDDKEETVVPFATNELPVVQIWAAFVSLVGLVKVRETQPLALGSGVMDRPTVDEEEAGPNLGTRPNVSSPTILALIHSARSKVSRIDSSTSARSFIRILSCRPLMKTAILCFSDSTALRYMKLELRLIQPHDEVLVVTEGHLDLANLRTTYLLVDANSLMATHTKAADDSQLDLASTFNQFFFLHSPDLGISSDTVFRATQFDEHKQAHLPVKSSANINAVWATLVIEECSRLGLRYICIAPGSRSSPLAIAAAVHPLTICVSCFDERSLAFHAVGFARGTQRPAVVITSSGTAVSNLLPAVVEASQDFVPLVLLTADRPPELQDAGSNQSINQVNHFGSFVRFFFNLPAPADDIPARMVLTTIDSAVYHATRAPIGPVHINCPFREPLEDSPIEWKLSCLKGLDLWFASSKPYTKYIRIQQSLAYDRIHGQINDVVELIRSAKKGILLIGSLHSEDEIWAAFLLVKHLSWPTATDILSGLRLRRAFGSLHEIANKYVFLDHLDHVLLSNSAKEVIKADVIVQIGSRMTSKRISQMLVECIPHSYIMVDKHPHRHDPSHIITHRVQSTITEFVGALMNVEFPKTSSKWSCFLQALSMMVAEEISLQIHANPSLTEPHVAQVISEALPINAALFFGNSMVIRDADMYGCGWVRPTMKCHITMPSYILECLGTHATGNRGASGIDGLLSTAVGFAVGSNKKVFCVIGDISLLHDTNGLALMKLRKWRKPMTIIVINNHGGAIFSLLPIAERTQPRILSQYFYTSHNVSIGSLCNAHGMNHVMVRTKAEFQNALLVSQQLHTDFIIEVESCIEDNAAFHSILRKSTCQAVDHAVSVLSRLSIPDDTSNSFLLCKIRRLEYSKYRIQLSAAPTSVSGNKNGSRFYREGFILTLVLEDGSTGFGEVAPLDLNKENLLDVEEQLRLLQHVMQGAEMSYLLPLLNGAFSSWFWSCLGIPPHSMFPSVRCGIEMAILNAVAARQGCSLSNLLIHHPCSTHISQFLEAEERCRSSSSIHICALLDSDGSPKEVADLAVKLVKEGFTAIKLKVGRRVNPSEDAAVVQEIRKSIGHEARLRVDANRNWTYKQALEFGSGVKLCDLQYIEEPVQLEDDIIRFCNETGLPVALDETLNHIHGNPLNILKTFAHMGIVALVVKPSVVGGFENAAIIAKWAQIQEKMVVISAAFESSLSLAVYVQFSHYLQQQGIEISRVMNKEPKPPVAHGLGTYKWLGEDVTTESLRISHHPSSDAIEASVENADMLLKGFNVNPSAIQRTYGGEDARKYQLNVCFRGFSYTTLVQEHGPDTHKNVLVFLHGFLGTSDDWLPVMKAISTSVRCISIDLPGHGSSCIQQINNNDGATGEPSVSIEVVADLVGELIRKITPANVVLLGYSMGARIALYMAMRCTNNIDGAVIISGSPGLKDMAARKRRVVQDVGRADFLKTHGLQIFLDSWYSIEFWKSLRAHPHFQKIILSRSQHNDVYDLANVLSGLSIGRQPPLWEDLKKCNTPLLFVCGEMDGKFMEITRQMFFEVSHGSVNMDDNCDKIFEMAKVPDCGHAVHLENPLHLVKVVRKFLTKLSERKAMKAVSSSVSL
ncbi:hypothetical protein Syun_003332 [Stephania yunnanensis]|uniref:Mandelate racemase/muconate lactonizing enzyme C-terminal domain-containing protein n=1 Tax=Stephania yunnanensis TaxID=152371 RepID=A0AAP0Q0I5_9MAGN